MACSNGNFTTSARHALGGILIDIDLHDFFFDISNFAKNFRNTFTLKKI